MSSCALASPAFGAAAFAVARAVAALADPTVTIVEAAIGARFERGLAQALDARILELDGLRLRFTHPLLGTAVAARQTPARRRALNARLADIVPSAEERARHLALATAEPDGDVASVLDDAARAAHARGAPAAAAELAEQALRLTPASRPDEAHRRLLVAAEMHDVAGDIDRATALLEQARAAASARQSAGGRSRKAGPRSRQARSDAVALYREALSEAEGDDALQATIHLNLARLMRFSDGLQRGIGHSRAGRGRRVADRRPRAPLPRARGVRAGCTSPPGAAIPRAEMQEAISLERSLESGRSTQSDLPLDRSPTGIFGHQLWWSADVDGARAIFEEVLGAVRARNDPLGESRMRSGTWVSSSGVRGTGTDADRHAADSVDLQTQLGHVSPSGELPAAVIAAHLGRIDEARAQGAGRDRPGRGRGDPHRAVGPRLGAGLRRALARRRRSGSAVPPTLV